MAYFESMTMTKHGNTISSRTLNPKLLISAAKLRS